MSAFLVNLARRGAGLAPTGAPRLPAAPSFFPAASVAHDGPDGSALGTAGRPGPEVPSPESGGTLAPGLYEATPATTPPKSRTPTGPPPGDADHARTQAVVPRESRGVERSSPPPGRGLPEHEPWQLLDVPVDPRPANTHDGSTGSGVRPDLSSRRTVRAETFHAAQEVAARPSEPATEGETPREWRPKPETPADEEPTILSIPDVLPSRVSERHEIPGDPPETEASTTRELKPGRSAAGTGSIVPPAPHDPPSDAAALHETPGKAYEASAIRAERALAIESGHGDLVGGETMTEPVRTPDATSRIDVDSSCGTTMPPPGGEATDSVNQAMAERTQHEATTDGTPPSSPPENRGPGADVLEEGPSRIEPNASEAPAPQVGAPSLERGTAGDREPARRVRPAAGAQLELAALPLRSEETARMAAPVVAGERRPSVSVRPLSAIAEHRAPAALWKIVEPQAPAAPVRFEAAPAQPEPVRVHIGTIEIRSPEAASPVVRAAPLRASRSSGFADLRTVRSYAGWGGEDIR